MLLENENFTIYEVEKMKDNFINELKLDTIEIDMQNISKIDMCAISLLVSLKKSADELEKNFTLKNYNDEIVMSLSICGCDSFLGV